ncbi:uncharacterized protein LOC124257986 [Haliotis rubra]|uniref:uncharacterized protein LOC124257986 n=1 Tax=Haliotis rubra TaxID=36100 RepID=UPI001EE61647|nr:uncharacterized protein LOC124257986 [Haliotis rubra]
MDQRQRLNVANGVISGVVILCGIIYGALTGSVSTINLLFPTWAYCFAYITPGIFGIVAAATKNTCLYITHLVLSLLTLCLMAFVSYTAMILLSAFSAINLCSDRFYLTLERDTCESTYGKIVGILVILILAWLLTLANCIISGILGNRRPETPPMIIQQVPQMASVVQMSSTRHVSPQYVTPQGTYLPPNGAYMTHMTPQGGYETPSDPSVAQYHDEPTPEYHDEPPPQYHDKAELVKNVAC